MWADTVVRDARPIAPRRTMALRGSRAGDLSARGGVFMGSSLRGRMLAGAPPRDHGYVMVWGCNRKSMVR